MTEIHTPDSRAHVYTGTFDSVQATETPVKVIEDHGLD